MHPLRRKGVQRWWFGVKRMIAHSASFKTYQYCASHILDIHPFVGYFLTGFLWMKSLNVFSRSQRRQELNCMATSDGKKQMSDSADRKLPVIIVCHGFKAFKDWGPFPAIGRYFAESGFVSIVFNFSHNGIGKNFRKFSEREKFSVNTFSLELEDVATVLDAISTGSSPLLTSRRIERSELWAIPEVAELRSSKLEKIKGLRLLQGGRRFRILIGIRKHKENDGGTRDL